MVLASNGPDIRQVKSGIRPDTVYNMRTDYPAGYRMHLYLIPVPIKLLNETPNQLPVFIIDLPGFQSGSVA
jgi:hypothetical protein